MSEVIRADHNRLAGWLFDMYCQSILKKHFHDFRMINDLPHMNASQSVIVTPNHFSWWDGFFIYWQNRKVMRRTLYILMLEEQLQRYWFFRRLGCYSIDLKDTRKAITSLKYTLHLVSNPDNLVTVYPQGEIQPYDQRPITIKEGIHFISRKSPTPFQILPVAFKIHHSSERLPFIYARFGNVVSSEEVSLDHNVFHNEFVRNLDLLNAEYAHSHYHSIL